MSRASKLLAVMTVIAAIIGRAASIEAALSQPRRRQPPSTGSLSGPIPRPVSFREVRGRGLLVPTWVNGVGPFNFAIDTGAGGTIMSPRVAAEARVSVSTNAGPSVAGLSGAVVPANDAIVRSIAIGDSQNVLPANLNVIVTGGLPRDLDGVLDPTDAFGSLGYVIDIPAGQLSAFDPRTLPVTSRTTPAEGAVVPWLRVGNNHRPFVMLNTGEKALIDTGSSLGFAIRDFYAREQTVRASAVYDVGGSVSARRAAPRTIAIGSLVLRNIPTDVISGSAADTPALLGLAALRPFRIRFDPLHRLIEIAPAVR